MKHKDRIWLILKRYDLTLNYKGKKSAAIYNCCVTAAGGSHKVHHRIGCI